MSEHEELPVEVSGPVHVSRLRVWIWRLGIAAWLVILAFALAALHKEWAHFHAKDFKAALARLGWMHVGLALGCTALSYFSNAAIDLFSLRWLGKKVSTVKALGCSYIAAAFSLNAGGTLLGGGGVRMRLYTGLGLTPGEVARMAGFAVFAGWAGNALVAGILLILSPAALPMVGGALARGIGVLLVIAVGCLLLWNYWRRGKHDVDENLRWPPTGLLFAAILSSALDWVMAGMAIRVLLPGDLGNIGTAGFLGVVLVSQLLSALSHVPGGVGVLELSITRLAGAAVPHAWLAAALLCYRALFYLLPFALAAAWMGGREAWAHRRKVTRSVEILGGVWMRLGPRLGALLALGGGFVLMLSANTPMLAARRMWLKDTLPLTFVETSHFLSSIAGVALIVVARGLQRRVHAAWWAAVLLSIAGMILSLLKGFDYEEALLLGFLLLCLIPYRDQFHRHAAMWSRRFTVEWWFLLIGLTTVSVWLGFFSTRHVEYRNDLWWRFSFDGDASRFLRAQVGVAVVLIAVLLAQWLRPTPPRVRKKQAELSDEKRAKVAALVAEAPQCQAHLALLGDKMFHFSRSGNAFLMYGEQGRSRIVMGDPVGDEDEWDDLLWNFNETAEDEGRRVCYYQISSVTLARCIDMGMRLFKLGEEARVSLTEFSLESPDSRRLRQARSRAVRDGMSFEMWTPEQSKAHMTELRTVSDQWLDKHSAREKSFSLGRFDEAYLTTGPMAVILKSGTILAFANLWCGGSKEELSIDLMRYGSDAPGGVMDYLFTELLVWGKEQGYHWFSLGMAPLSGMAAHPLAPLWQKLGSLIYLRGGAFYNFRGLRDFKEKFHPEWDPHYLAVPSPWHLPAALTDITTLIGGGWRGVMGRQNRKISSNASP
ncbi:bifunctional lysylphosphatidylglycerol flippase/synthetase MprF [Luteolibacter pohnpeiensis]|uniref:Bifunctional lysylphosphatidylglycerol flippase/synthetase MprF n=1 Tax=Luteolibacter pohnpeiensis TaxID=454153 RepID=A0A934VW45_9BACT|nr:bifunctional lysylphosphatidylglycerol flippase/synthetase MprF [Luteolibacter pohnpeiensis]MBK1882124.1 bifunctional lysylphosphatidylglycerol flippase/synthetase MprF [Luteolibacter pohnpeiensis]